MFPPSIGKSPPVHDALASDARNATKWATSRIFSGWIGIFWVCQIRLPVRDHLLDVHAVRDIGGDHLGAARLRADRIHPDAELAELERRDSGHPPHRPLAGGVGDQAVLRREPVDGGDVDDGAGTRLLHRPDHRLDPQEGPDLVDANHALELGELGVRDGGEKKNPGVVHQNVEGVRSARWWPRPPARQSVSEVTSRWM